MKKRYPKISYALMGAIKRSGYSVRSFAEAVGIPYPTFNRRLDDPGGWRLYELQAIFNKIDFLPDETELIRKEVGFV